MSKFLKFIVHLVILCTILGVLALVVPPFIGFHTTIIDSADTETNLDFGSVTYARSVPTEALQNGDSVVVSQNGGVYSLRVTGNGEEENSYTMEDPTGSLAETQTIALGSQTNRVILTVPYLGFLMVAVQSTEGLIIIGLAVLFLIILYIIAELWKKDTKKNVEREKGAEAVQYDALEEEVASAYNEDGTPRIKTKKELKQEEKARAKRLKEEDRRMKEEDKGRRKREKKRRKAIRTGGFVDDLTEEDLYEPLASEPEVRTAPRPATPRAVPEPERPVEMPAEPRETIENTQVFGEEAKPEPVMEQPKEEVLPEAFGVEAASGTAEEEIRAAEEEAAAVEPAEIRKMAIPLYTAQQLHRKAQEEGDDPEIYQDEVSGVTLFDYSRIISGEEEEE